MAGEERRRLEEAARRFVEELAEDFATSVPRVRVYGRGEEERVCGVEAAACYNERTREIMVHEDWADSVGTLLHEFAHHLQLEEAEGDPDRAYTHIEEPHCRRPHEAAAKWFADNYWEFYAKRYRAILSGEAGPRRDGRPLCGFSAARLWEAIGRLDSLFGRLGRRSRAGEREAMEVGEALAVMDIALAAFMRACGLGGKRDRILAGRDEMLERLKREGFGGAQEHLGRLTAAIREALARE
jgi:hypothetical protein